ncbi:MAG: substrate-binding domain-containing protein [Deltaproteobacteria bacterium]|nr:substrate-binding domain-containing protein [Deltaproteobacteria bacterium]
MSTLVALFPSYLRQCLERKSRWFPVALLLSILSAVPATAAQVVTISGTGASLMSIRLLADAFMKANPQVRVEVLPILGTGGSIRAVIAGKLDIGVGSRPLKDEERNAGVAAVLYARVPFVFGVHRDVKADGITLREVVDIYAGRKTTWDDGSPIRLILRPEGESDVDVLRAISKDMAAAVNAAMQRVGMFYAMNDHECASTINVTPGAFGALTLPMATQEERSIRVLPLDGVIPTRKSLADGTYPHQKEFIFITGKASSDAAMRFIGYARSRKGAAILSRAGLVPVRVDKGR